MKYMGSKRALLANGLGEEIKKRAQGADRIVDLFAGSASVAWFSASQTDAVVLANDLQTFSKVLADAVLLRTRPSDPERYVSSWVGEAARRRRASKKWRSVQDLGERELSPSVVEEARQICASPGRIGPIWNAYGGHYYSPSQALTFDYMLASLPKRPAPRALCLAATIWAATRCAASPGHTAQPLQPSSRGVKFVSAAWSRDPLDVASDALHRIAPMCARARGTATVGDALALTKALGPGDLVFIDPPYSSAQYSRFYHVLETMARGQCGSVSGTGRYPPIEERPQSDFSLRTKSEPAMGALLKGLADAQCEAILTFPQYRGSNGLESDDLVATARQWFSVDVRRVSTRFSTLGGNGSIRASRRRAGELVLSLYPR